MTRDSASRKVVYPDDLAPVGTVPDSAVAATGVTQHQGSIAHQSISGAGSKTHAQLDTHVDATAAHGATGAVVGTTNAQTLTSKTLTTPILSNPIISNFSSATHNHTGSSSGGPLQAGSVTTGTFADARIAASNVTQHVAAIDHNATLNYAADQHFPAARWRGHNSVAYTISGFATITLDVEDGTSGSGDFSLASNQVTIKKTGIYLVTPYFGFAKTVSDAYSTARAIIYHNAAAIGIAWWSGYKNGSTDTRSVSIPISVTANDTVECKGQITIGANVDIAGSSYYMGIVRVG